MASVIVNLTGDDDRPGRVQWSDDVSLGNTFDANRTLSKLLTNCN